MTDHADGLINFEELVPGTRLLLDAGTDGECEVQYMRGPDRLMNVVVGGGDFCDVYRIVLATRLTRPTEKTHERWLVFGENPQFSGVVECRPTKPSKPARPGTQATYRIWLEGDELKHERVRV